MLEHWIWLARLPQLHTWQKISLLQHFHDPEELYNASLSALSQLPSELVTLLQNKDLTQARAILRACREKNIQLVTLQDSAYPRRLRNTADAPLILYYKGRLPDWDAQPVIGIVGTRKASPYGLSVAKRLSSQISVCGGLVVSGGAAGIDTLALQGALACDKKTVAILACGLDRVYPKSNAPLFDRILEDGCLLSEYPPGEQPMRWHFPERNRIISGVSNGVLIVEAPHGSGALITAGKALEQGRDVFAVPGNIDVPACAGSNALLQGQASPVLTGWDVMKEYAPLYPETVARREPPAEVFPMQPKETSPAPKTPKSNPSPQPSGKLPIDNETKSPYSGINNPQPALTIEEKAVLALLNTQPVPVDTIIAQADIAPNRVLSVLTMLAVKGVVKNHPGGLVSLAEARK